MDTLHQHTMDPLPDNLQLESETIDILTWIIMYISKSNCRQLFTGKITLSPVYKNITHTLL